MRCVNLDWLEVYCLEDAQKYPCDAEYFRSQGYLVREREYGTRQYAEMFTILDDNMQPLIEVRRNPKSGDSSFSGFVPESCHLRLPNWVCYQNDPVGILRDFMLKHDYIFKRIFRIDVCYDFEYFDSGDQPERFARRYLNRVYRKINQCRISAFGEDSWNDFAWETISWGNKSSMVSTKMYNKTKELAHLANDKPYIRSHWFMCGLVDNPVECTKRRRDGSLYKPDIWRVEFSMKSAADNWLVIEDIAGKKPKKRAIRHSLSMFDSREKLWQRFQDLAYHYFHFKYREYKDEETAIARIALNSIAPPSDKELKRKDRCRDKVLFHWDKDHEFLKVQALPSPSKASQDNDILLRRLRQFKCTLTDPKLSNACTVLIEFIEGLAARRLTSHHLTRETQALQAAIALKIGGDSRSALEILEQLKEMLVNENIF
jgi:hypothetical protein